MKSILTIFVFFLIFGFFSCEQVNPIPKDLKKVSLIPQPTSVEATGSSFTLNKKTKILFEGGSEDMERNAQFLAELLRPGTGFPLPLQAVKSPSNKHINLLIRENGELGEEGYELEITEKKILLQANTPQGAFRGIQSLLQMSYTTEKDSLAQDAMYIASGIIKDTPFYDYRGAMLDVSRHFFSVEEVKTVLDWLTYYKMNTLHLHLSDDQGWRIEIKKWPLLTELGGETEVGGTKGGFFTQEDFKEIVAYAAERYITIVPEIDMPGHTNAALASYAFLNCDNQLRKTYTGTKVGFSTFCTSKDSVYSFIDDVVGEIISLNPNSPYFHIGGDESLVTKKEDYLDFVSRVQKIVKKHGKQMMGWDEIANIKLEKNSVVQFWNHEENALKGIKQGAKLLLSPASRTYLDMKYDSSTELGLKWAGMIEVDHGYNWDPLTFIPGVKKENILGIECPLWTETVTNMDEMEYLVFPRLPGYAELGWSDPSNKNWESYKERLAMQVPYFNANEINFYKSPVVEWGE